MKQFQIIEIAAPLLHNRAMVKLGRLIGRDPDRLTVLECEALGSVLSWLFDGSGELNIPPKEMDALRRAANKLDLCLRRYRDEHGGGER